MTISSGFRAEQRLAKHGRVVEEEAQPADYCPLRSLDQSACESGLPRQSFIDSRQERGPAGKDYSAIIDVAGGFRRQRLEGVLEEVGDASDDRFNRFVDLDAVDKGHLRTSTRDTPAFDTRRCLLFQRERAAQFDLHPLRGSRPNQDPVVLSDHLDQRRIQIVPTGSEGPAEDEMVVDHRGDGRRSGADIDEQIGMLIVEWYSGAEQRDITFIDEVETAHSRLLRRITEGVVFDVGRIGRDGHQNASGDLGAPIARFAHVALKQLAGEGRIGDGSVLERTDDLNIPGGTPLQLERLETDRDDLLRGQVVGEQGRLIDDYTTPAGVV